MRSTGQRQARLPGHAPQRQRGINRRSIPTRRLQPASPSHYDYYASNSEDTDTYPNFESPLVPPAEGPPSEPGSDSFQSMKRQIQMINDTVTETREEQVALRSEVIEVNKGLRSVQELIQRSIDELKFRTQQALSDVQNTAQATGVMGDMGQMGYPGQMGYAEQTRNMGNVWRGGNDVPGDGSNYTL